MKRILLFLSLFTLAFLLFLSAESLASKNEEVKQEDFQAFIEEFLARRTSFLTENPQTFTLLQSKNGLIQESTELFNFEKSAVEELERMKHSIKSQGEVYTDTSTKINIRNFDLNDDTIIIKVEEYTELNYKKATGEEPGHTAWVSERKFIFNKSSEGNWELVSQKLVNAKEPVPLNEPI